MASEPHPSLKQRYVVKNVQALRALAVLLVVLLHLQLPRNGIDFSPHQILQPFSVFGKAGVDLFFAISGFIMLVTNWEAFGKPKSVARFFLHRLVRIYPPYWLALLPLALIFFLARRQLMIGHDDSNTDLLASLLLYPEPIHKTLLPPSWTLTFEMTFYVFFAGLLFINRRHIRVAILAWSAIQVVLFAVLGSSSNPYLRYLGNLQPMEFIFGMIIGLLYIQTQMPYSRVCFLAGVALSAAVCYYTTIYQVMPLNLDRVLVFGIPSALLLYGAVAFEKTGKLVSPTWLVAVGDSSYATYLWHFSIIGFLRYLLLRAHFSGRVNEIVIIAIALITVQLFASVVYNKFEVPVTRTLNSLASRHLFGDGPKVPRSVV